MEQKPQLDLSPRLMPQTTREGFVAITPCQTASEFLDALSPRGPLFEHFFRFWIFRGHPDDSFELLPSALRQSDPTNGLSRFHQFAGLTGNSNHAQATAEMGLLRKFFEEADRIGLPLPEDTQNLRELFKREIEKGSEWPPLQMLSLMALAQHHHLPTRLLDWSRSAVRATYFSINGTAHTGSTHLSVWAFNTMVTDYNKDTPWTLVTTPAVSNSNLRAQHGLFTLARSIRADDAEVDRQTFDQSFTAWAETKFEEKPIWFHRVTLPRSEAYSLRNALEDEGITETSVFPDFYGVVRSLENDRRSSLQLWEKIGAVVNNETN